LTALVHGLVNISLKSPSKLKTPNKTPYLLTASVKLRAKGMEK